MDIKIIAQNVHDNVLNQSIDILSLCDETGWTVAHELVYEFDYIFTEKEILLLRTTRGWYVASELIYQQSPHVLNQIEIFQDIEFLSAKDDDGDTIAHTCAMCDKRIDALNEYQVLTLYNNEGITVAHCLAANYQNFDDKYILCLADHTGWTVAHEMAKRGYVFTDPDILDIMDLDGIRVEDV